MAWPEYQMGSLAVPKSSNSVDNWEFILIQFDCNKKECSRVYHWNVCLRFLLLMSKGLYKSLEESGVAEEQVNKEITRLTVTEVGYVCSALSSSGLIRHYETSYFYKFLYQSQ